MKQAIINILKKYLNITKVEYENEGNGFVQINLGGGLIIAAQAYTILAAPNNNMLYLQGYIPPNKRLEILANALQNNALYRYRVKGCKGYRFQLLKRRPKVDWIMRQLIYKLQRISKKELKKYF